MEHIITRHNTNYKMRANAHIKKYAAITKRAKTIFRITGTQKMPKSKNKESVSFPYQYSQAFGVARKTDKFRPRYSAGVH